MSAKHLLFLFYMSFYPCNDIRKVVKTKLDHRLINIDVMFYRYTSDLILKLSYSVFSVYLLFKMTRTIFWTSHLKF